MAITQKSIKILWSAAAGLCAFPDCRARLTFSQAGEFAPFVLGEMAHICGDQPDSNRHDSNQTPQERDDYQNLILLCPTHHRLIDRRENETRFPAISLLQMKAEHETFVCSRLTAVGDEDKHSLAVKIAPLLAQNHQAWLNYGPMSELARRYPHDDAANAVWLSERLSTIVPNNRRIIDILDNNVRAFPPASNELIAEFRLHARSYERWVRDEVSYSAVLRFPTDFSKLIEEALVDGTQ